MRSSCELSTAVERHRLRLPIHRELTAAARSPRSYLVAYFMMALNGNFFFYIITFWASGEKDDHRRWPPPMSTDCHQR